MLVKMAKIDMVHEDDFFVSVIDNLFLHKITKGSYLLKTCSQMRRARDAVCRVDLSLEEV